MGTWGTGIKSNDTSSDIYDEFFESYDNGEEPNEIAARLISENQELINNPDDSNNFWFALALALWETKSLSTEIFDKVEYLIVNGVDIKVWETLDADNADIQKRKLALEKLLIKLKSKRTKSKPRKKKRNVEPIFRKGDCLTFKLKNGNYGAAVVLAADSTTGYGYNLIVSTRINQPTKPEKKDLKRAMVLVTDSDIWTEDWNVTWYLPDRFEKEFSQLFEVTSSIEVSIDYEPGNTDFNASYAGGWNHIIDAIDSQLKHEQNHEPAKSFPISKLISKPWWKWF